MLRARTPLDVTEDNVLQSEASLENGMRKHMGSIKEDHSSQMTPGSSVSIKDREGVHVSPWGGDMK